MSEPSAQICIICKKKIGADRTFVPFCSGRCRQVDLGKWLNEDYKVPSEDDDASTHDNDGENG